MSAIVTNAKVNSVVDVKNASEMVWAIFTFCPVNILIDQARVEFSWQYFLLYLDALIIVGNYFI